MPSRLLRALYPQVMVLYNINFTPPSHQTRHTQSGGEQLFVFLFCFWKGFMGITVLPTVGMNRHMCRFLKMCRFSQFFPTFVYEKQKQNKSTYYLNEYEKFFLKFPYIFSKPSLSFNFYKLYRFMKICYNRFQYLSEFYQIIKHFYNFLKSKHKFWISFL